MAGGLGRFAGGSPGAPPSMLRRAALLPLVVLLTVSACGGKGENRSGGNVTPSVSPSASGSVSPSSDGTDGTPTGDDGSEENSRPDVLSLPTATFSHLLCGGDSDPTPHITLPDPVEMLLSFRICFIGFDPTQEIDGSIQASDGTVVASDEVPIIQLSGTGTWRLTVYPEDPIVPNETYTVTGTQGAATVATLPLVVSSSERRIAVKPPFSGPAGSTFSVALAGFDPQESVPLYLYSCQGAGAIQTCTFVRDLPLVQMDENGQGLFSVPTSPEDPPGGYAVGFGTTAAATFVLT
jgi:hypothetical protein